MMENVCTTILLLFVVQWLGYVIISSGEEQHSRFILPLNLFKNEKVTPSCFGYVHALDNIIAINFYILYQCTIARNNFQYETKKKLIECKGKLVSSNYEVQSSWVVIQVQ